MRLWGGKREGERGTANATGDAFYCHVLRNEGDTQWDGQEDSRTDRQCHGWWQNSRKRLVTVTPLSRSLSSPLIWQEERKNISDFTLKLAALRRAKFSNVYLPFAVRFIQNFLVHHRVGAGRVSCVLSPIQAHCVYAAFNVSKAD